MFSAKIWFMKTSTRNMKYISQAVKLNPALTGYSCEDFPSIATQSHLLLRKDKGQISNLKFHKT